MCKRINQTFESGKITTFTTGNPQGSLPNFDVTISSPAHGQHRSTDMTIEFEQGGRRRRLSFNGRNARTLYEVLSRHFEEVSR
jgi:hypothetical protein